MQYSTLLIFAKRTGHYGLLSTLAHRNFLLNLGNDGFWVLDYCISFPSQWVSNKHFFCWKCKHHFSSLATVPKSLGINQITTSTFLQSQEKPPTKEALAFCIYRGAYKNTCVLSYIIHRKVLNLHIKKYCNCDCVPTCKEAKNKKRESMMSRAKCIGGKLMMIFQIGSSCFAYFFVWV